jgi:hypothetical protein
LSQSRCRGPAWIRISSGHELGAVLFLWAWDLVKFWVLKDLLKGQGIDPVVFLFFDMVTVPFFIVGFARLVNALAGKILAWPLVVGWGIIVLVNTFLPYVYAAVAGEARFTPEAWAVFWCLVLLVLANLIRTIASQVKCRREAAVAPPRLTGPEGDGPENKRTLSAGQARLDDQGQADKKTGSPVTFI